MSVTRRDPARAQDSSPGPSAAAPPGTESDQPNDPGVPADPTDPTNPTDPVGSGQSSDAGVAIELKVLISLAVLAGIGLRFVARSPLWLDEALSVNIAALPLDQIPEALRHDGHPPLYYLMLHGWMQVFGQGDTAVRALSGLTAVLTLPLGYLAGRRAGGRLLGWLTLGVLALSPFVLRYATETRMYSLVILLVFAGYLLLDDLVRRGRTGWGRVGALAVVVAALLYSHYWSMWLLGGVFVVLAVLAWRTDLASRRTGAIRGIVAIITGGVLFLPWVPSLLYQSKHTGTPWAGPVRPTSLLATTLTDFGGGAFKDAQFVGGVLLVLVLLALFGATLDSRRIELDLRTRPQFRAEATVVAVTIAIALVVSYASGSAFASRYTAAFLPLVVLMVAGGLSRFTGRGVLAGAVVVVLGLFSLGAVYNITTSRTQAQALATVVATAHQPGDVLVYCPDQLGPAGVRVMPTDLDQIAFPTMNRPDRVDWVDYVERNRADPAAYADQVIQRAGDHGIFVVWSSGYKTHQGTCEALLAGLGRQRPDQQTLVGENGDEYYEHASLTYFGPNPPVGA